MLLLLHTKRFAQQNLAAGGIHFRRGVKSCEGIPQNAPSFCGERRSSRMSCISLWWDSWRSKRCSESANSYYMEVAGRPPLFRMKNKSGAAALPRPTMNAAFSQKCHSEERSDVGIRIPLTAAYHAGGIRIATPACGLVRNDRVFDKRYGAFRRRGEGTPPYAWVEGAVCGRRRGVGEIGEAPPAADEASRFRGSAPIGGHDSGRESAGTTVGSRRPLRMRCDVQQGGTMWGAN